jgi:predicted ATPase
MIKRVIIENFKSIRKLDLELEPINILIGANGAGKSNFISFFKLANQIYEQRLQDYIGNNIDRLLHYGRKKSDHISGLIDFDREFAFKYTLVPYQGGNTGYLSNLDFVENAYGNGERDYNFSIPLLTQEGFIFESRTNTKIISPEGKEYRSVRFVNSYLSSFRPYHFHDTGSESPIKQMSDLNDNRYLRENGKNLSSFLYYLQEKYPLHFNNIESQINSVAHFFERFDLEPDRLANGQIELRWREKGNDAFFNAYDLSDGTLRFIALTTLLLQPNLPKTIIIDEPELGLHPVAINKIAALIKQAVASGTQIIIATQSTGLIDNFEPEDIIAVDREQDQSVFRRLSSENLKNWLDEYTVGDLWNKNVIGARP